MDSRYVYKKYLEKQKYIKNLWLANFVQVLALLTFFAFIMEIVIFYTILSQRMLLHPVHIYWLKFILTPIALELGIVVISYFIYNYSKIGLYQKQLALSICFVVYGFVATVLHTGYVAILAVGIIPILISVIHERYSIIIINFFLSLGLHSFGAFTTVFDPWKKIDGVYLINSCIIFSLYFVAFILGIFIVRYYRQLSRNDLMESVDRFNINERVHVEGVDSVVSFVDLMAALGKYDFSREGSSIILIDIHDMTHLNKRYSFEYGDKLLKKIAESLKKETIIGSFYRYGGDKFCVAYSGENVQTIENYLEDVVNDCKNEDDNINLAIGYKKYDQALTLEQNLNEAYTNLQQSKKEIG